MRKLQYRLFVLAIVGVMILGACGSTGNAPAETTAPVENTTPEEVVTPATEDETTAITFTDHLDRTVTVENPQRVATLIGSFADIWCLAGGKDTLVATASDSWTQFDLDLSEDVIDLGAVKEPNLEVIIASEPDFIIASSNTSADLDLLDSLEATGIPVAYFTVSSVEDYLELLKICTDITGRSDLYEENGTAVMQQIEDVRATVPEGEEPTVLYIRASGSSCKVKNSKDSVLGEMLADLGGRNIADSDDSLLENLSMEAIMVADPEMIFIVLQGSDPTKAEESLETAVLSQPTWQELTAVKEGRVYYMDQSLYNVKPNGRWGEAYEKLAGILYE